MRKKQKPDKLGETNLDSLYEATQSGIAGILHQLLLIRSSDQYHLPEVKNQVEQIEKHIIGLARLLSGSDKLIDAYMQVWDFLCSPSAKHFKWLSRWLTSPYGPVTFLDPAVLIELVKHITNTIVKEINLENKSSGLDFSHWWVIMKWGKEKELVPKDEKLNTHNIKNIILFFCKHGKIEEAKKIHEQYKGRIIDDPEDLVFEFNQSIIDQHEEKN